MPRLNLDDGYTLDGTAGHAGASVAFKYRPALPDAIYDWRHAVRGAATGKAELDATARFVAAHLVSWDVEAAAGPVPPTAENVRKLPDPILAAVLETVLSWAPKQESAAGNS